MGEVADAYAGCRARIADLTAPLDDVAVRAVVPACPAWSVHDVVAHVSGVVDDALAGRLDGVATDPWTAAQVAARRDRSIADMLGDWDEQAPAFEALLDDIGAPGRQAVADIVTHEHDLRGALEAPGARDSDAVQIGFGFLAPLFVASAADNGVSVRVRTADGATFGDASAPVVLNGNPFDLLRAMTGRRSLEQLGALQWEGDGDKALPAFTFGPFCPAAVPIEE